MSEYSLMRWIELVSPLVARGPRKLPCKRTIIENKKKLYHLGAYAWYSTKRKNCHMMTLFFFNNENNNKIVKQKLNVSASSTTSYSIVVHFFRRQLIKVQAKRDLISVDLVVSFLWFYCKTILFVIVLIQHLILKIYQCMSAY